MVVIAVLPSPLLPGGRRATQDHDPHLGENRSHRDDALEVESGGRDLV
jgi:hypothetical protein